MEQDTKSRDEFLNFLGMLFGISVFSVVVWGFFISLEPKEYTEYSPTCCVRCTIGKACGDTCIEQDDMCHVGQGCACD